MSFASFVAGLFRKDTHTSAPAQKEASPGHPVEHNDCSDIEVSDISEHEQRKRAKCLIVAAKDTFALCSNFPESVKNDVLAFLETVAPQDGRSIAAFAYSKEKAVSGDKWTWDEWEYWKIKCEKIGLRTLKMFNYKPESIDFEKERKNYNKEKIFNILTLSVAKNRLNEYLDAEKLKRADILSLIEKDEQAWHLLIDPHIQKKWDSKKHDPGETPVRIFKLMLTTIIDRGQYLYDKEKLTEFFKKTKPKPGAPKVVFSNQFILDDEEKLYGLAQADPDCPWKHDYGYPIPGGHFWIRFNFDDTSSTNKQ